MQGKAALTFVATLLSRPLAPRLLLVPAIVAAAQLAGSPARSEALDLSNAAPRTALVRFEISPPERPGALDHAYSQALPARVEATAEPGRVRVVIDGSVVERHLFVQQRAKPGSFGDFVWTFDADSGEVVEASLEGVLLQTVDWGLVRSTVEARIRVAMNTREPGGFFDPRSILGHDLFAFCGAADAVTGCRLIDPVPLDRKRGYVNAVGPIEVESVLGLALRSFSPLGEAIFLESPPAVSASSSEHR